MPRLPLRRPQGRRSACADVEQSELRDCGPVSHEYQAGATVHPGARSGPRLLTNEELCGTSIHALPIDLFAAVSDGAERHTLAVSRPDRRRAVAVGGQRREGTAIHVV